MLQFRNKFYFLKVKEVWFTYKFVPADIFGLSAYLYVKNDSVKKKFSVKNISYTVENSLSEEVEEIFGKFSETTRQNIRNSEKEKVECYFHKDTTGFINFFNDFADAKKIYPTSKERMAELEDYLEMSYAVLNGEILAAHSYIVDKNEKVVRLYHAASKRFDEKYNRQLIGRANKLLTFKDMVYFKELGFDLMDFGGYAEGTTDKSLEGINKFKLSFGGKKVICNNYYSPLYFILKKIAEKLDRRY